MDQNQIAPYKEAYLEFMLFAFFSQAKYLFVYFHAVFIILYIVVSLLCALLKGGNNESIYTCTFLYAP